MAGIPEAHNTKILECPVCYTVFQSRVFMCTQGHNICGECRPNVEKCPLCRSEYTGARNHLVEQLLSKTLLYACENTEHGCETKLSLAKVQAHQQCCPHRLYQCFVPDCIWEGRYSELKNHTVTAHATSVSSSREILFSDRDFSDKTTKYSDYLFVTMGDELFVHFYKRVPEGQLKFNVIYIGPTDKAHNFHYMLAFHNENRSKKMQFDCTVSQDANTPFSDCCLEIDYDTCKQFVRYNGVLQYFLKLERQGWNRSVIFNDSLARGNTQSSTQDSDSD